MQQNSTLSPTNNLVRPLLTDLYQISMVYGYWKMNRHNEFAVFDLFFRKNPFRGEYTVFAGLEEVIALLNTFKFSKCDVDYLRDVLPEETDPEFFAWLLTVDCSEIQLHAIKEGSVVFPRLPVVRVEGPLGVGQLLETGLLNLLNFASLVTTNATRFRQAAGKDKMLLEFGLRRAQGPDGAMSASRYSYMAGFNGTSNVLAGKLFNIPIKGTHAHSYVQSYSELSQIQCPMLKGINFVELTLKYRELMHCNHTNEGELAAFISYALSFPNGVLALVDTYDTLKSGILNFLCVALALNELGYKAIGIRLDSGDLAYLSNEARKLFIQTADKFKVEYIKNFMITASNDINEAVLNALNGQGHSIDCFGIGTNLVTCQAQPALGMVYKLVEIENRPRIKLSQDISKVTIPGRKEAYRLLSKEGIPILDLLIACTQEPPRVGEKVLCRHPFEEIKRAHVTPHKVVQLHHLMWDGKDGGIVVDLPSLEEKRNYVEEQMNLIRADVLRPLNATPYKVSVSSGLYDFMHDLWMKETPILELH